MVPSFIWSLIRVFSSLRFVARNMCLYFQCSVFLIYKQTLCWHTFYFILSPEHVTMFQSWSHKSSLLVALWLYKTFLALWPLIMVKYLETEVCIYRLFTRNRNTDQETLTVDVLLIPNMLRNISTLNSITKVLATILLMFRRSCFQ